MKPVNATTGGAPILAPPRPDVWRELIGDDAILALRLSPICCCLRLVQRLYEGCDQQGMFAFPGLRTIQPMQRIQIGEVRQKTVLDMIQEMAARQAAEIEQLKMSALKRAGNSRAFRSRQRCTSPRRVQ